MKKKISNQLKKLFAFLAISAMSLFLLSFSEKEILITEPALDDNAPAIVTDKEAFILGIQQFKGANKPLKISKAFQS